MRSENMERIIDFMCRTAIEFRLEILWNIGSTHTFLGWLFHIEGVKTNWDHKKSVHCFWIRGHLRVIGVGIRAGFYHGFKP